MLSTVNPFKSRKPKAAFYVERGPAKHLPGFCTDGFGPSRPGVDRHDGGFID